MRNVRISIETENEDLVSEKITKINITFIMLKATCENKTEIMNDEKDGVNATFSR